MRSFTVLLPTFTLACALFFGTMPIIYAQTATVATNDPEAAFVRKIYDHALTRGDAYHWLTDLCRRAPARLSGSPQAAAAVELVRQALDTLHLTGGVRLLPCTVPYWVRGEKEQCRIVGSSLRGDLDLRIAALGGSSATPNVGLEGEVVEVHSLKEVDKLGEKVRGKIVFYNRPMDPTNINTFRSYGQAGDQRVRGPQRAANYGAAAVVVRSLSITVDDFPHTGVTIFDDGTPPIPCVAVSTRDAETLASLLAAENKSGKQLRLFLKTSCQRRDPQPSFDVIGEILGTDAPNEVILVGGHLDSWDLAQGAHDDGAGVVQAMQVVETLKALGYQPRHTIRCVAFMNEENGSAGAKAYAVEALASKQVHIAAIESDEGGFTPRGFTAEGDSSTFAANYAKLQTLATLLEPYGLSIKKGGSGADVDDLRPQKGLLIGLSPDSQRYFDVHHTANDTIDTVSPRELTLGAAAMTALVYLLDRRL